MSYYFLPYYLLKDSLDNTSYNNQTLFRLSLFYNACDFYKLFNPFKNDKINIKEKLKNPEIFFLECLKKAKESNNDEHKLFCYCLIVTYFSNKVFSQYTDGFKTKFKNSTYIEKMLDSYLFHKNEKMPITSINIADYFFESFQFTKKEINFITKPFKKALGFFSVQNYYLNCYDNAHFYFEHLCNSKTGLKRIPYFFYDILFNHKKGKRKAKTYLYSKKIDTNVLNLKKKEYSFNNKLINLNFDEFYLFQLTEAKKIIKSIDNYFQTGIIKNITSLIENI